MEEVIESASKKVYDDLGWLPEDYGFKLIVEGNDRKPSVWKHWTKSGRVFVLMRIARTLFVLKKEIKSDDNGIETIRRLVKFHTVIDSKPLADVYLIDGLRG